ncbi:MFS general substrate transporter [Violaceomyces palustris]|uniref:MFS general substrate transporter n=1 Tax=Violaceomyces palustris TaxID=1673888 RepID=A0ACD0NRS2_9BASI|nr:MFS general substrate transporter [Violaceomyces palustris]
MSAEDNKLEKFATATSVDDASAVERGIRPLVPILPETIVEQVDEEVLEHTDASVIITPEENKRLLRIIDRRVLPVMVVTYFLQSLDKGILSLASIMGIQEDWKLKGQQYSWLTTCVYLAILVAEYPQNRALQVLPINRWLGFCIISWGAVTACSAAIHNFTGAVIARSLLGVFECVCQPAFLLLASIWYKKEEQARTISLFYCMNGLQTAVGGLLAYGFYHFHSSIITSYQLMFMLLGIITVFWGAYVIWLLPVSPMKARGLSKEDKIKIVERVRANQTGLQNKKFKTSHLVEALYDPQTWAFFLIQVLNTMPVGGLGAFTNIIIKTNLGFSVLQTDLLNIAQGGINVFVMLSAAWLSKRTGQTLIIAAFYVIPSIISAVVFLTVPNDKAHSGGLLTAFLLTIFYNGVSPLSFSLLTRNVGGQTKRSVAVAINFIGWAVGNAAGPQLFRSNDAPHYRKAFSGQLACYAGILLTFFSLRVYYMDQNRRRRRACNALKGRELDAPDEVDLSHAFDDLTDKQNINFRYSY